MASLNAYDVSFELPNGRVLFQHLSLTLQTRVTALVGPNGVGKTCFAKILAGLLEPTSGYVISRGTLAYFAQRETAGEQTVLDFLGGARSEFLDGIDVETRCRDLSGGQWMRVRLTRVLNTETDILILDEPTNDLDRAGRASVHEFIRKFSGGVLLISHDRELLSLCEDVVEFSNRGVCRFGLSWNDYVAERDRERASLESSLEIAKRTRGQAEDDRRQLMDRQAKRSREGARAGARGGLPKILLGARKRRAENTSGRVNLETLTKARTAVSDAYEAFSALKTDAVMYADMISVDVPANMLVAEANEFNLRYASGAHRGDWVFSTDLNFSWRGAARVAIRGPNGSGKSTLLRALASRQRNFEFAEMRGGFRCGTQPLLSLDQRCETLNEELSVLENMENGLSETELRNGLAKFLFTGERVFQKVRDLSGGERLRTALAKGFLVRERPTLMVLDEPTNNLDLGNIEFLEKFLRAFRGALIVVSHDEMFLNAIGVEDELRLERSTPNANQRRHR